MTHSSRSTTRPHRRGVAMLLVIISLAMATILASAYLASRDNSTGIGTNVVESATARWASQVGIEYAKAILETETDWRTDHVAGKIVDDLPVGAALLDIDLEDVQRKSPPTDDTSQVKITSIAIAGGMQQVTTAYARIHPSRATSPGEVDFSEFAVFGADEINLSDNATIGFWTSAPSGKGARITVGTAAVSAGRVRVELVSNAIDTDIFHNPGASSFLVSEDGTGSAVQAIELPDAMPWPDAPSSGISPTGTTTVLDITNQTREWIGHKGFQLLNLSGSMVTVTGDRRIIVDTDANLINGTGMVVDGDVRMIVFGNLKITNDSFIELLPGARLTMWVGGQVDIGDSYIGDLRSDRTLRDTSGDASYINPGRIRMFGASADTANWNVTDHSVLKGSIYAPKGQLKVGNNSALYGAATTLFVEVKNHASVFADPSRNKGRGFTNTKSRLYDNNGRLRAAFKTLSSLNPGAVQAAAVAEDIPVEVDGTIYNDSPSVPPEVPPTESTPRTISVDLAIHSVGVDPSEWEDGGGSVDSSALASRSTDVADLIKAAMDNDFVGSSLMDQFNNRTQLATWAQDAADDLTAKNFEAAHLSLTELERRVDGSELLYADLMYQAAPTRADIHNRVWSLIVDIEKLLP
ncbi:MAG: DUF7305 domain-containing protein [Phycisphaerales bacterium]